MSGKIGNAVDGEVERKSVVQQREKALENKPPKEANEKKNTNSSSSSSDGLERAATDGKLEPPKFIKKPPKPFQR